MAEKSLVEQALLEAKAITESVKESAKEILPSLLKKEINELIKESIDDVDAIELDSEEIDVTDDMDMDMMGMDMDMGAVELDLTSSSDDEVMKVFKKMGPEEELEEASMARTFAHGTRASSGTRKGTPKSSVIPNKSLAKQNGIKESRKPRTAQASSRVIKENKMLKGTLSKYGDQVKVLKGKNEEYKKALSLFREKLNEVAVFNSNLAYTTKLFTDHSTTKKEKLNILSRFDEVVTLKESKSLYKKINGEVSSKGPLPIREVISKKGGTRVITESSNSVKNSTIRENKVYQDPQMKRMMDLMGKL